MAPSHYLNQWWLHFQSDPCHWMEINISEIHNFIKMDSEIGPVTGHHTLVTLCFCLLSKNGQCLFCHSSLKNIIKVIIHFWAWVYMYRKICIWTCRSGTWAPRDLRAISRKVPKWCIILQEKASIFDNYTDDHSCVGLVYSDRYI